MRSFPTTLAAVCLSCSLFGATVPAYAAGTDAAAIGQALSFCVNTLTNQEAAANALQADGFEVKQRSEKRLTATKATPDARVMVFLKNLNSCTLESQPAQRGEDARSATLVAMAEWAKSKDANFALMGKGQAKIEANSLNFTVTLKAIPIRGAVTASVLIRREK